MKRLVLVLVLLLGASGAFAYDLSALHGSQGAFVGAINGALDSPIDVEAYLPGYGFQMSTEDLSDPGAQKVAQTLAPLIKTLAPTLQGLDSGDWISVSFTGGLMSHYTVVVRMKQGDPASLEVWIDGKKQ